ncbi:MAG: NAD(P)/FAD-dependent oxidoreductase [Bacteroidetes bacterium]|nr:NAD(P)/FAD-dependent oxidoreductase [Bacteroidota bacterium]MBS1629025.1 NAD(P)/FAD-dependent oxidoreductase [Bacteroidota bacterium]
MAAKRIVILGAGFAGLQLARRLKKSGHEITLIDQFNFHQFQPLFYQVATARLEPSAISFPLRKIFQHSDKVHVRIARVHTIDLKARKVLTEEAGDFSYDYLVLATGCQTNFFGNKNLERYAFPMKSTPEAIALRNRILLNFEAALSTSDEAREALMNIAVIGGGPTGVELAGALAEMKRYILPRDYPDMDFSKLNIYLIEGSQRLLINMSEASGRKATQYLNQMGVQLRLNALVKEYDGQNILFADGQRLQSSTLIWAAGVKGSLPAGIAKELLVRGNRIHVDEFHRIPGYEQVFAIGDLSYMETPEWPKGHPQLANVAIHQAKNLARNICREGRTAARPFRYKNPGTMATVGKKKAVVDLPKLSFQGFFAWWVWMFLHLMLILSVRNKLMIFINWGISYFSNDTTLRLILLPTRKQIELAEEAFPPEILSPAKPVLTGNG